MVYLILANGFEEIEALTPADVLRRAGLEVKTVGISGKNVVGAHGITVMCDVTAEQLGDTLPDAEMLIFPGGMPGADNIDKYPMTDRYIKCTLDGGGFVGAYALLP